VIAGNKTAMAVDTARGEMIGLCLLLLLPLSVPPVPLSSGGSMPLMAALVRRPPHQEE
jgi:hypothetical protein